MKKIKQLIDEIAGLKKEPSHKSALRIYSLLENNKKHFVEIMDTDDFDYILTGFADVSQKSPLDFKNANCIEEYKKLCENFLFHGNRIV